ncbi:hypothetical protein AMTRI_Chr03g148730 [Amborella trichopoda]
MGLKAATAVLLVATVCRLLACAFAQTSCTTAIISLSPCLNYISGNSSTPAPTCCSQLANVVSTQPRCLCTILGGGGSLGITINQTKALELPGACNVQTPPVSTCNSPGGAPSVSPAGSPEGSVEPVPVPGGKGANTPPAVSGAGSIGVLRITPPSLLFLVLLLCNQHAHLF